MSKYLSYLWLVLLWSGMSHGDHFDECDGMADESFVQSLDSCQSYVYCMGEDSLKGDCDDGEYFDAESGGCDDAANVQCFLDEVDEPELEPEPEPEPEEAEEEELTPATAPPTDPAPPVDQSTEVDILNIAPVVKPNCPISDDPSQVILMASNESCTNYYLCYHGHAMEMHCTNQLYFNALTGQCDHAENVQCALEDPRAHKCLPHMTEFFPHPDKCNYFYYCIKGFLTIQQCPFYYGWDIERRSCVQINVAKCYGNSRRTSSPLDVREQCHQGVTKRFSYPQNCNYFYYCVDGFLLVEQCPIGYAFNATTGACGGRTRSSMDCTLTFWNDTEKMSKLCVFLFLMGFLLGRCQADEFAECIGNDGGFVSSQKSCAHYIFCNGNDSYDGECPDGEYFSSDTEMCEPMGDIDCRSGQAMETDNTPELDSSTDSSTVVHTESPSNSTLAAESLNATSTPTSIDGPGSNTTVFAPSVEIIVTSICPREDNKSRIILMANQNSCTDYYVCYQGEPYPMNCAATLHFNPRTGKCDHPENVRCMATTNNPREQCKRHTMDIYPHPDNCNYFYQCRLGYLIVQQCPFFYGWDHEKRSCVVLSQAKCYNQRKFQ
ncbi:uncharacterized protein [Drosophila pseudoobscura]|uniref:Chitin-binding type-2 domain-containing protein n=1 Tax=Drosophila pseudoobscura pseudoobscura TaxID=46245 RepID=A0A6I8W1Z8_DROPS|nr:uncharacterized protein LOC4813541 [Drosophila pseudoobscura]